MLNIDAFERKEVATGSDIPRKLAHLSNEYKALEKELENKYKGFPSEAGRNETFKSLIDRDIKKNRGAYPRQLKKILLNPIILGEWAESEIESIIKSYQGYYLENDAERQIFISNERTRGDNSEGLAEISKKYGISLKAIKAIDQEKKSQIKDRYLGKSLKKLSWEVKHISCLDLNEYQEMDEIPKQGIIALKSGCGTGKTTGWVKRYIDQVNPGRVLYVTQLKATIDPFVRTLREAGHSFYNYQSIDSDSAEHYQAHDYLAITDKSLNKLFKGARQYKPYDLVIIDECEKVFSENTKENSRIASNLERVTLDATATLVLDADISEVVTGWGIEHLATIGNLRSYLYINSADYMEGMTVKTLPSQEQALQVVDNALAEGQSVYLYLDVADKKKHFTAIKKHFQKKFPHILVEGHTAEQTSNLKKLKANSVEYLDSLFKNEEKPLRLLIVTPWSERGWDYNSNIHAFDITVGIYTNGYKSGEDVAQAMRRARRTTEHYVFINRKWEYNSNLTIPSIQETVIPGYSEIKRHFSEEISDQAIKRDAMLKANPAFHLKLLMEERGADYQEIQIGIKPGMKKLLQELAMDSLEAEIREIYECSFKRGQFLQNYYIQEENSLNTDLGEVNDDLCLDDFTELYKRSLSIRTDQISEILHLWFMDKDKRRNHGRENNWMAIYKGELLDKIDELIDFHGLNDNKGFKSFVRRGDNTRLNIFLDKDRAKALKSILEHILATGDNSYLFQKKHKTQIYVWLQEFFGKMDFDVERQEGKGKKQVKPEIIQDYKDKKLLVGIKGVNAQIAAIGQMIEEKADQGERLSRKDIDWIIADGELFIVSHKLLRDRGIYSEIQKSLIAGRRG